MRRLLVRRDYVSHTGGQGKFLDYITHVNAHPDWEALVYLTPRSRSVPENPFVGAAIVCDTWQPEQADALLLGGTDWTALDGSALRPDQPIVNLVQGVRHAEPGSTLRGFLRRRAVRVCVSEAVADAIIATGDVSGPVRVIPAAVDVARLSALGATPPRRGVFIDAVKHVELGRDVARPLAAEGVDVDLLAERLPRAEYLARMADAMIVVTLPDPVEGFYLPGLEAMAMGRALVQHDCVGSREYVADGINAVTPARSAGAIVAAVQALRTDAALRGRLAGAALATARRHDVGDERRAVHALLDGLEETWRTACATSH